MSPVTLRTTATLQAATSLGLCICDKRPTFLQKANKTVYHILRGQAHTVLRKIVLEIIALPFDIAFDIAF